jgi:serine/threonine protein kinase
MRRCLNPRNPHKNATLPLPVSAQVGDVDGGDIALIETVTERKDRAGQAQAVEEQQATCQFCKYLLEDAMLGDCRVIRWIGSGTFGDVYEAEQLPPMSRKVAIKVMSIEHLADGEGPELFEHEVRTIATLDHPHILPVYRVGMVTDGRSYLVMKFAAHGSLQKFCPPSQHSLSALSALSALPTANISTAPKEDSLDQEHLQQIEASNTIVAGDDDKEDLNEGENKVTPQQLLPYLEAACDALQYAHDHGLIHLDIKPANLLLDGQDRLMLADFGVSTLLEGYTHASLHGYVGTPLYTAPEQWLEQPRVASDQYALAVTCYQLLTGRAPFTGNLYAIMHGHIQTPPPPLSQFQPLIPEEIESVILRALAKEPTDRFHDMHAFAQAYREALELAASAQTDAQRRRYMTEALIEAGGQGSDGEAEETHVLPGELATESVERAGTVVLERKKDDIAGAQTLSSRSTVTIDRERTNAGRSIQPDDGKLQPRKRSKLDLIGLCLIALLLLAGSGAGIARLASPCLFGICPLMSLGANTVTLSNSSALRVTIRNSGSATLDWSAARMNAGAKWLSFAPSQDSVAPGETGYLTIRSNSRGEADGTYTSELQINGQHVATQYITVTMQVRTGLNAVDVQANLQNFTFVGGMLEPSSQTITITNKSGHMLSWLISYSENTWLVVTPDQGNLANGKSITLNVTANTQNLTPNTYETTISLLGRLPGESMSIIQSYMVNLTVAQAAPTVTPTIGVTTTPAPPVFQFPNFTAQPAAATGAPATLRSGHSMVWDNRDDALLVFGGIDNNNTLLNDLWEYSPSSGNWTELSPQSSASPCGTAPMPRMNAALVWDSADQQLLLYGGIGANNHYLGDLWSFSMATKSWTLLKCSGNGPGYRAANAVWDGHEMLIVGGINKFGMLSDFWSYTPSPDGLGQWQHLPSTPMSPRAYQTLVWDSTDSRLYLFGGLAQNGVQMNDFWSYSTSDGWTQIAPNSSSNPLGREQAMGSWDSKDHLMILSGGYEDGQGVPFWGFWVYDPHQNAWGLLLLTLTHTSDPHIPGRTDAAMVYDAADQRIYLYAGAGNGQSGSSLNDLWMVYSS